jgi:hypothetical protein
MRCILLVSLSTAALFGQTLLPSPQQWLYPSGTPEGTRSQPTPSAPQPLDSFRIKWRHPALAGEGTVLVGKVLPRGPLLPGLPWAPNELIGVAGDTLVVLEGSGRLAGRLALPPFLWDVCAVMDTTALLPRGYSSEPALIAVQSSEHRRPDSTVATYLVGYDARADTLALLRQLVLDMRPYGPNLAAALVPFAARRAGTRTLIYGIASSLAPRSGSGFLRGVVQFASDSLIPTYPVANLPDERSARLLYGPRILAQPSALTQLPGGIVRMLLPLQPDTLPDTVTNRVGQRTAAAAGYLIGVDLQGDVPASGIAPVELVSASEGRRPVLLPLWVRLRPGSGESERPFILLAEGYSGGNGMARLHLYDANGSALASPQLPASPAVAGLGAHLWSIGIGDMDAPASNSAPPFYPNNPGMEIVACPNTPEQAVTGARLLVVRYRTDLQVPKQSPPGSFLAPFDTIASAPCSGWLAAVADVDGDGRAEALLADGEELQLWRLRPYSDPRFALGAPFDTVARFRFPGERITAVAVADIDGDGRSDLLVRTRGATYAVGIPLLPAFAVLSPRADTALCITDTLRLRWVNFVRGHDTLALLFQPYRVGRATGQARLIGYVANSADTVRFDVPVRHLATDTLGRFLLQSTAFAQARDSSGLVQVLFPQVQLYRPAADTSVTVGDSLLLQGLCRCADSLVVELGVSQRPEFSAVVRPAGTDTFSLWVPLPCPSRASCWEPLPAAELRLTAHADTFRTALGRTLLRVARRLPIAFSAEITPVCPELLLQWDSLPCPEVLLGYSEDGATFTELAQLRAGSGQYRWQLPVREQETALLVRLCCQGCYRADTVLLLPGGLQLQVLAPNPLKLPDERLQIVYALTQSGTARVRILDAANNLVRELVPWRFHAAGQYHCEFWDGTAYDGASVPTGVYYVLIEAAQQRWVLPVFVRR